MYAIDKYLLYRAFDTPQSRAQYRILRSGLHYQAQFKSDEFEAFGKWIWNKSSPVDRAIMSEFCFSHSLY